ncbi:MAG: outer membrane beta-barrel protein [Myxococcota bacterium]|nr:outer membrane beta-barrel protein [Myxococcota bacterium]
MKRRLVAAIGVLVLILVLPAASAWAQGSIPSDNGSDSDSSGYLQLGLGAGRTNFAVNGSSGPGYWGFGLDAAAGVTFSERVRWDVVMLGYNQFDVPGSSMSNSRFDLQTAVWIGNFSRTSKLHPYIGASLGSARFSQADEVEWGFAWGAGAGLEYQVTSTLALGPRYMFRQALLEPAGGPSINLNTHQFTLSIVWSND